MSEYIRSATALLFLVVTAFVFGSIAACDTNPSSLNVSLTNDPEWANRIQVDESERSPTSQAPLYFPVFYSHVRFLADGNIHKYHQFVIKGNDTHAILSEARQGFIFNPAFQKLEIHFFGLHRNGVAIDLKDQVKPNVINLQSDLPGVYLGQVQAIFEMHDARPSDTLEIRFSTVGSNPVFAGKPWYWQPWHFSAPVLKRIHEVSWHSRLPVQVKVWSSGGGNRWRDSENAQLTRQTVGDWTTVRYSGTNLPQARFDENSASEWPQTDVIQASVIQDWDAVGAWAKNLFDSPAKPVSPAYQTLLSDLRRLPSQPEQAESALRWVQREIRYVSLSLSENSHLPHAPDEVLSRRFGDCKDKTLLLTHLLRDLGLQAHPALMSLQTPTAPRKVSPAPIFDHAVVVAWINMKMHVLDATLPEQVSSLDYFSPWHAGADLFVLDGPFSGFVAAPQSAPLGLNRLTSHETMKIQANGQQGVLSVEVTHEGVYADETRWLLGRKGVEAAKALYLTEMRNRFPDAQWNEEPEAIDDALRNRLILKGSFSVGTPLKRALNSRWRFEYNNGDVMSQLPTTGGVGRVSPLDLGQFLNQVVLRRTLELPEGWLVDEENFDESTTHPAFKARVRRSVSGNAISDEWQLQLLANHISLDSLKGYLDAVKSVEEMPTHIQLRSASHAR